MLYNDDVPELGEFKFPYPKNVVTQIDESKKGHIIEIEGLDGSGKSTQIKILEKKLKEIKKNVYCINFIHSEFLKNILLKTKWENCDTITFSFMYLMGLSNVYYREIVPKLKEECIIILDRYIYTVLSKALIDSKIKKEWIENCVSIFRKPDIKIFIDTPVEECLRRKSIENKYLSYWECGGNVFNNDVLRKEYNAQEYKKGFLNYQRKVRDIYEDFIENENWSVINGLDDEYEVSKKIYDIVNKKLLGGELNE